MDHLRKCKVDFAQGYGLAKVEPLQRSQAVRYFVAFGCRGQPGGWSLFLIGQEKYAKEGRPDAALPCSREFPALPDSMRRLRNSTWRDAQNAPHCRTDSVPGGRKLERNLSHGHLY